MRRRLTSAAMVLAVVIAAVTAVVVAPSPSPADAAGTPPACVSNTVNSSGYADRRCDRYTSVGPLGSIGLVGDSVLLGSANGLSSAGLPSLLNGAGWGPINLIATLGMKTSSGTSNISGQYWIKRWHDNGFHPDVIAVNLGANHLGSWNNPYCTPANPTNCTNRINDILSYVDTYHPNARIWWAKVNHEPFGAGNGYSLGMLGWNAALDLAAASRSNLVVWDWPTALATANPSISMDTARVHPSSGTQYVKRSTLMRDHIGMTMPWATYTGPRTPLPAAVGDAVGYDSLEPSVVFDSADTDTPVVPAGTVTEIDLSASAPDGAVVADLVLSTTDSAAGGWLTAWSCEGTMPVVSSLNFAAGIPRTSHALVRLNDRTLCIYNSAATALTVHLSGWFGADAPLKFTPIAPQRPLDTRNTGIATDLQATVPSADALAVTVTVTGATSSGGTVVLRRCDNSGPELPVLAFQPGEVVAGAAFAAEWADQAVCLRVYPNSPGVLPHVILDVTGTFTTDGELAFVPAQATRLLDTRSALGGWVGRHGAGQVIDVVGAPPGAQAVSGTITFVRPVLRGWLTAFECGQALPPTSSVNAAAGLVMANSLTVGINESTQTLCIRSSQLTHTLFDAVGWWVVATPPPSS